MLDHASTARPSERLDEAARERLLHRYARHRDPHDLETLVVSYRPLACSLARRYSGAGDLDDDLEQAACEGLVKAVRRFDPQYGTSFTSFAVPTILGEVRRFLRDTAWPAHVPRKVQEQVRELRTVADDFAAVHGRAPSVAQLVDLLGAPEERVVEALAAARCFRTVPLEGERRDDDGTSVADRLGADDPGFEHVDCMTAIAGALPMLPPDQKLVLALHFIEGMSQRQIAVHVGFSRSQVGRVLESALARLRQETAMPERLAA